MNAPSSAAALPVLDMARLDEDESSASAFRDALRAATHDVGFFHLVGHGIPDDAIARAFSTAEAFFALPEQDKHGVEMLRSPHFRGYTRTGGELTRGQVDWREQIDLGAERAPSSDPAAPASMRLEGPNPWPAAQPELRAVFTDWEQRCSAIARRLTAVWAVALGSPADVFDDMFGDRPSMLIKLVRYPGREERGQGVGAHSDPGVLTLLMIEPGRGGLQVERDSVWIDVPAVPGAFVVNIGELLEFATDGYLEATAHGDNLLKARLRAHPDVAAAHHPDLVGSPARP